MQLSIRHLLVNVKDDLSVCLFLSNVNLQNWYICREISLLHTNVMAAMVEEDKKMVAGCWVVR